MLCRECVMPDTRPDHVFVDGVCPACITAKKNIIDIPWDERRHELEQLLDKHGGRCIVPSSGGKDSTYQVMTLIEMGADPLVVTASTCHLTEIGRKNIDNLAQHATTIEVTPNRTVRAKLNRMGLELVGDISWPEHVSIFTTPFRIARETGISLIMYGENPQNQYGGPSGTENARQMTARWRSEYGGFLGLRPRDFVGMEGITARHMTDYELPDITGIEAHFLGQYVRWNSRNNARVAKAAGMIQERPCTANWWDFENLDNAQTGIHDHFMYKKYGYGRAATQLSVDIREHLIIREMALQHVERIDGLFPMVYAGVEVYEVLDRIGVNWGRFCEILEQFTNWDIFAKGDHYRKDMPLQRLAHAG